jgi:type IV secretion system protein VirB11
MSEIAAFRSKLECIKDYLDDPQVTEIAVNRPCEVWIGRQGQKHMDAHPVPALRFETIKSLADLIAHYSDQSTSREAPILSATMPINLDAGVLEAERGGYRVQVVMPPAVEQNTIALCIRKPTVLDLDLAHYQSSGAFEYVNEPVQDTEYSDAKLHALYKGKCWQEFLRGAVKAHKNIVISAGTNAGKTALLNALLKEVPEFERFVTIEDSREIQSKHNNCLHLLYSRGGQGVSKVSAIDLLEASLRLTPDRVIMGELRGAEAYSYLELLNTGHSGSLTTIHADSPQLMYERLSQMVMRFGSTMTKDQITDYAKSLIQVVVQLKQAPNGSRYISEILYENAA